jgi:23S rRNA (uracil1939-C5)-methyltransferase
LRDFLFYDIILGMKHQLGQIVEVEIERLGIYGEGVGYADGYTIFVEGALPGERVLASLSEVRKNFARATVDERLKSSPHRIDPPCALFQRCGGCQLMHLEYLQQLEIKRQRVKDALERIGKIEGVEVLACEPSPMPLAYRNKIQLPCALKNGSFQMGLYAANTHELVEIDRCLIHCELGESAFGHIQRILKASPLVPYNSHTHEGILRHVLIKTAFSTQEILVILVTAVEDHPALPLVAGQILEAMPEIKGVVQNIHRAQNNVILGHEYRILAGQGAIQERLLGLIFKVSPASFFQVNPGQAEKLYQRALALPCLTGSETVLDAYCGVGTLSLVFAQKAKRVIGVECVAQAIGDAKENAIINGMANVEFHCAQAEDFIETVEGIDVIILNPPRKGCDLRLLEKLGQVAPQHVIYISCDPATLARDLAVLKSLGYQIKTVQPFDMFPQTAHVETLVHLHRD